MRTGGGIGLGAVIAMVLANQRALSRRYQTGPGKPTIIGLHRKIERDRDRQWQRRRAGRYVWDGHHR